MSSNPFQKRREEIFNLKALRERRSITTMPDAIPIQQKTTICPKCHHALTLDELEENLHDCRCGYHFPIGSHYRLQLTMDPGTIREIGKSVKPFDWLHFPGYPEKLKAQRKKSGSTEGVSTVRGKIGGYPVVVAAMDTRFFMGSMGSAVGARMQEGIISLMQMAKTSAAMERLSRKGILSIMVLTHPTTGGVTASFAMLGDITLAEPGALIGFAGPRVIEQTIGEKLPEGFQRSEFQMEHGFVDQIVPRGDMRKTLIQLLRLHARS
jgi:acetyl-CoA carboxylase carboxyl transferase subunit beta